MEILSLKGNPLLLEVLANYKLNLVKNLKNLETLDDEEISVEERFKILGMFPKHLIGYSEKLKTFYT